MIITLSKNKQHYLKIFLIIIVIISINTLILYFLFTENDIANLPSKDKPIDRIISLFYYNTSVHGSFGDGTLYPISNKAKIYTTIYLLIIAAGILTAIDIN
jgi:hypothetical protein